MRLYGENGDCFVRLYSGGVSHTDLTLCVGCDGAIELFVKSSFNALECSILLRQDGKESLSAAMRRSGGIDGYDRFVYDLRFEHDGLYFFSVRVKTMGGELASADLISSSSLTPEGGREWQILVCDESYQAPEWLDGGVIYHIFIDRFARGGDVPIRSDAIMISDWDNGTPEYNDGVHKFKNNTFFGGTLYGVIEKLDYLSSVGVTCIYLSPCFEAYSNHKYDVGDYMKVDDMFGGDAALEKLISEAGNRGMRVILDGVFNHVGDDSVYFNRYGRYGATGACQDKNSPYYDWFTFSDYPNVYDCWWGIDNLPKVKKTREFRNLICKSVIPKYMAMGVSGWRLDVVDELEGDFLEEIVAAAKSAKNDAVVIGEVWEDASDKIAYGERKRYFRGKQLDSVMNYPLRNGIVDYLLSGSGVLLKETLRTLQCHYPPSKFLHIMNIIGTHDTERILTLLGGASDSELDDNALAHTFLTPEQREVAVKKLKVAYSILAFIPGVPCIYYGDEAGSEGYHDPFCRRPFPWHNQNGAIRKHFSAVNSLRKSERALTKGDFELCESHDALLVCRRRFKDELLMLCANASDSPVYFNGVAVLPCSASIYKRTEDEKWSQLL